MDASGAYQTAQFAEIYDAVYADRDDAGLWLAMADVAGGPVLELGCGTGRVLLSLARAGFEVAGLDLSSPMIARARANLQAEPPGIRDRVRLSVADMTTFDLQRRFGQIISPFGGFQHLRAVDDQLACLARCRAHLVPHGLLVLDLFNPSPVPTSHVDLADEQQAEVIEVAWGDTGRVRSWIDVVDYDPVQQSNLCEMVYEFVAADGGTTRVTHAFLLRYLFRFELEHLLVRSGFELVDLFGDYDRSPFAAESPCMIAVARLAGA